MTNQEAVVPSGAAPAAPLPRLTPGTVLRGRFTIEQFSGPGLFGETYRAVDGTDGKPVLLKLLPAGLGRETRSRLEQDVAVAAQLNHKNVAVTYGFFAEGDLLFVASEPVDGVSLRQMLERKLKG